MCCQNLQETPFKNLKQNNFIFSKIKYLLPLSVLFLKTFAQSSFVPLNSDYYYTLDRYEVLSGKMAPQLFTSVKPYLRSSVAALTDSVSNNINLKLSKTDKRNLIYLRVDNWEHFQNDSVSLYKKELLKIFYARKNAFYSINEKHFNFQINPVAYFQGGQSNLNTLGKQTDFMNTRGFEARGIIDGKVGFYTYVCDNQIYFPHYIEQQIDSTKAVPQQGFWSTYKKRGYDFYDVRGYINFNITKHINTQFGQDKNFIGNGYRSLFLSDNAPPYLFLKFNTTFKRFQYTNIYAQMVASNLNQRADVFYPRKFMTLHYLTVNLSKNFNLGFFESITFGNTDSINTRRFDPTYLNPIIFFKAVENGLGSSDKAHIGADFKWNFLHRFSLYGSVFIDEFVFNELKNNRGWWGNKQAVQFGFKHVNLFGIKNLDVQAEFNAVRPYTYTHFSFSKYNNFSYYSNYTQYNQYMAHPLGANFKEAIGILRYQPTFRLNIQAKLFYAIQGLDTAGRNFGANPLLAYNTRYADYGNYIGQGLKTNIIYASLCINYQIIQNMFIEASVILREEKNKKINAQSSIFNLALRWNIARRQYEF